MSKVDPAIEHRQLEVLSAFILRARRVEQHSLATDKMTLPSLASMQGRIEFDRATGKTHLVQDLPPEEQVESAAARVRPLILHDDPTFHGKVMQSIGFFIHHANAADQVRQRHRGLKDAWNAIDPKGRDLNGYYVEVTTAGSEHVDRATDNILGFAWIYGDVVHHDADRLTETKTFGVTERYRAAVPLVARIMILTISTLNFVRTLQQLTIIPHIAGVHETDVTVSDTTFRHEGKMYVADPVPAGATLDVPPVGHPLGDKWKPIETVLIPPTLQHSQEPHPEPDQTDSA